MQNYYIFHKNFKYFCYAMADNNPHKLLFRTTGADEIFQPRGRVLVWVLLKGIPPTLIFSNI